MKCNIAIIGAGAIGRRRADVIKKFDQCQLNVIVDIDEAKAKTLAGENGAKWETDWKKAVTQDGIDICIVSTVNNLLCPITIEALQNNKHVLCEKPLGINQNESNEMLKVAKQHGKILKTGFNLRYHPAIRQAKKYLEEGKIGPLCYLRCRYGHGGRAGYDKEWRANGKVSGGGELLDQGVHVADLFRWFAGDFAEVFGCTNTYVWDTDVEDNAFAFFKKKEGVVASMHTSWTQWKNLFCFEVFGKEGYLIVEGLGGSYGKETLRFGQRNKIGGAPNEETMEYENSEVCWTDEWEEFLQAIDEKREPNGSAWDGFQSNMMIDAVYASQKSGQVVHL